MMLLQQMIWEIVLSSMEQIGFNFIRLKEDCTELNSKLTKGSVWIFLLEQENNYIINLDGMYYGPLKNSCERI